MPIQAPSTTSSLDPQVVNLARAIRQTESGGDFKAKGASGEHGAYQFMPETWSSASKSAGVNVPLEQATPEQQNEVAYKTLARLKQQHPDWDVGNFASYWNSGDSQAYKAGKKGLNTQGVSYDVPAYAEKVATNYQKIKSQGAQPAQNAVAVTTKVQPSQTGSGFVSPPSYTPPSNLAGGASIAKSDDGKNEEPDDRNIFQKGLDFALPIVGDISNIAQGKNKKSGLQLLGDAALSGSWFIPGAGLGVGLAEHAAGGIVGRVLGQTGAKIAGRALEGGAVGYGQDVASNLSEDKTGLDAAKPGLGTLTGGVLGAGAGAAIERYKPAAVLEKVAQNNEEALGATKRGAQALAKSSAQGKSPGTFLAQKGINLRQLVNPKTVHYETTGAQNQLWGDVNKLEDLNHEALAQTGAKANVSDVENEVYGAIKNNPDLQMTLQVPDALKYAEGVMSAAKQQYGEEVPLEVLNKIKQGQWKLSKFDASKPGFAPQLHRLIGNTFKGVVENEAEKAGLTGVKEFNQYIGDHLDAIGALEKLHGNAGKGGRIGDLLQRQAFQTAGGIGGAFGGGPVGSVLGALVGGATGDAASGIMRKLLSGPLKGAILRRAQRDDPEAVKAFLRFTGQHGSIAPAIAR